MFHKTGSFFLTLLALGCSHHRQTARSVNVSPATAPALPTIDAITISQFRLAEGHGTNIIYDGRQIKVISTSDFNEPEKVLWQSNLSPVEHALLNERIERLSLGSLKDEYPSGVWDGWALTFTIQQIGRPARRIEVANQFVEELAVACDSINLFVPFEYRIPYREWNAERQGK